MMERYSCTGDHRDQQQAPGTMFARNDKGAAAFPAGLVDGSFMSRGACWRVRFKAALAKVDARCVKE